MVKHSKRQNKKRKYTRKVYGGNPFTDGNIRYLRENGFTQENIDYLERRKQNHVNIPISFIQMLINKGYSAEKIIQEMEDGEDTDIESQSSQEGGSKTIKNNRNKNKSIKYKNSKKLKYFFMKK
jgi:hypothetical protein